jgi:hypothetical protein
VHDLTAARTHRLADALTIANVMTYADKAYQGAGGNVRTPFKRHRHRPRLSRLQKTVNRNHAKIRAVGQRAVATLKGWKSWASSAATPDAPPRSSRPSSSYTKPAMKGLIQHVRRNRSAFGIVGEEKRLVPRLHPQADATSSWADDVYRCTPPLRENGFSPRRTTKIRIPL